MGKAYIIPKGDIMCMEGDTEYMKDVLARLTAETCNMRLGWVDTTIKPGKCTDAGYFIPSPEVCFPKATLFFDGKPDHMKKIQGMDMEFVQMFKAAHPELPAERFAVPQVECSR